jgi:hypothetical protein
MKYFGTVLLLLALAACSNGGRSFSVSHPYTLETSPPPGSPLFQQAYTDGCETAMSGMGSQFIKMFHNFQYDAKYANNTKYNRVWQSANDYCRLFLFVGDEQLSNPDFQQYNKPVWAW